MICADCREPWEFGPGERDWFASVGAPLPRRCKECRARRRGQRAGEERLAGVVARVNEGRGFGFITGDSGKEFFFRMGDAAPEELPLRRGARVTFSTGNRADGPRQRASLVKLERAQR